MSYQSHGRPSVEGGPRKQFLHGNSTSMVDLPNNYATSTEHLGDIEEYPLSSNTTKSQSVPRLTLLTISSENDKSELWGHGCSQDCVWLPLLGRWRDRNEGVRGIRCQAGFNLSMPPLPLSLAQTHTGRQSYTSSRCVWVPFGR